MSLEELETGGAIKTVRLLGEVLGDFVLRLGDELGGGGRGRSAEVGGEVGDGEVGFVADGGDDGEFAGGNRTGDALAVEGSEIFKRTAAAGEDDKVDQGRAVEGGVVEVGIVQEIDGGFDFGRGLLALDRDGDQEHAEAGVAASDNVEEVANDGPCRGGDYADGAWKCGEWALAGGVEEALGFEALLELLEGELKRAGADGLHGFRDELKLAALFVDADAAADDNVEAVLRAKAEEHGLAAKENDGQLSVSVFEREVEMAGGSGAVVGDFAFDPDVAVLLFDEVADLGDKLADGPDAARLVRILKGEVELRREWVVGHHQKQCNCLHRSAGHF